MQTRVYHRIRSKKGRLIHKFGKRTKGKRKKRKKSRRRKREGRSQEKEDSSSSREVWGCGMRKACLIIEY